MAIFGAPKMTTANPPAEQKSRWQLVIDHLNASHRHLSDAMNLLSQINFDLQKGADFISRYRDNLIGVIEANGGQIEQDSVEEQIKEFLPKALQRDEAGLS